LPIAPTPALARDALFSEVLGEKELAACSTRLQGESFLAFSGILAFDLSQTKRVTTPAFVVGARTTKCFTQMISRQLREPMEGGRGYSTAWRRI
jgi:hypothetical protein